MRQVRNSIFLAGLVTASVVTLSAWITLARNGFRAAVEEFIHATANNRK